MATKRTNPAKTGTTPTAPARKSSRGWNELKEFALVLYTVEGLSFPQVAARLQDDGHSTHERTIRRWADEDEWKLRAAELRKRLIGQVAEAGICDQATRMIARDRRYRDLQRVVQARAEKAKQLGKEAYAGEDTGWLIRVPGKEGMKLQTDTALAMALLEMEKATAAELGQSAEKERGASAGGGIGLSVVLDTGEELPSYLLTASVDALDALIGLVAEGYDLEALSKEQVGTLAGFVAGAHLGFEEDAIRLHEFLASVGRVVPTTTDREGKSDA